MRVAITTAYPCHKLTLDNYEHGLYVQENSREIFITIVDEYNNKILVSLCNGISYSFDANNDSLFILEKKSGLIKIII
jgi:hypothetical protein